MSDTEGLLSGDRRLKWEVFDQHIVKAAAGFARFGIGANGKPFVEYLKEQGSCLNAIGSVEETLWRARELWRDYIAAGSPGYPPALFAG